jgi:hypothetical protein
MSLQTSECFGSFVDNESACTMCKLSISCKDEMENKTFIIKGGKNVKRYPLCYGLLWKANARECRRCLLYSECETKTNRIGENHGKEKRKKG